MMEVLMPVLQELVMVIAGLMISLVGALGSYYITKLVNHLKDQEILEVVSRYVKWAAQAPGIEDLAGHVKLELVLDEVQEFLAKRKIYLDREELEVMVEAALADLKKAANPVYPGD